jgi:hypothetical protein
MVRPLPRSEGSLLGFRIEGTLTAADVGEMHRAFRDAVAVHGEASLLVEIGDLALPEPSAVLRDLRAMPEVLRDVRRLAVVGDGRWQAWAAGAANLLARGEARHFDAAELDTAWTWLRDGPPRL